MGEEAMDWLDRLRESIKFQVRHTGYDRSIEVRQFAHMISTGRGQEKEVTRYRRYETDDLKDQRNRLYNPLTKYAISRPRKQFKKIWRVEGIRRSLEAAEAKKLSDLNEIYSQFEPGTTLEAWLVQKLEYLGVTDPNAWILCERFDSRDEQGNITKVTPYAFIIPCIDALDFKRDPSGNLSYLLYRTIVIENISDNGNRVEQILTNYYLYYPGGIVRAREVGKNTKREEGEFEETIEIFAAGNAGKKHKFFIKQVDNGTREVPAICAGVYMDEVTGSRDVFVPWFDPAEHELKDLIRYKSTNDVITTLHAFPKRWEFEKECSFKNALGDCVEGYLGGIIDREHICPACKGTGFPANFTTEQASVKLLLPSDAADQDRLLDLSKLSFVEPFDTAMLTLMDERTAALVLKVMEAVFDSGLYQRPEGTKTKTATEVRSVMEGISDVLKPFCGLVSRAWELFYRIGAQYMEFEIKADHEFPEDLQIQSLSDEVAVFDEIKNSGVGFEAMAAQRSRVLAKITEGNPDARANIEAKYQHEPFAGKSAEQIAQIVVERSPVDPDRVLWENFEAIFVEIFNDRPEFYKIDLKAQKTIVAAKVEQFKQRVVVMQSEPTEPNFSTDNEPQPEDQ